MSQAKSGESEFRKGTVKWFNDSKGWGFLQDDDGGEDVFVHHTAIDCNGFRSLREGEKVEYTRTKGKKGWQAVNVRSLDPKPARPRNRERSDRYEDRENYVR